ncbi:unnamed protein product [Peniophora sp. CBMAI 1063]|nr:unnamed protein product [Peniophora sp. CBMAI 1063]
MTDTESQERLDQQIAHLERQLEHEVANAGRYQTQLSALHASFQRVSRALGCTTPEELDRVVFGDRTIWNRTNIEYNAKRVPTLKEEVKKAKERISRLEREGEAHIKQLDEREKAKESLQESLLQSTAERDNSMNDLITARTALASVRKELDETREEISAVRLSHDNMRTKHLSLRIRMQGERARRLSEMKRLSKASKTSKDALYQAAMRIVFAFESLPRDTESEVEVKLEGADSDGVFPSLVANEESKTIRSVGAHDADSSPVPVVLGTSSIPNTPTKPRRALAAGATSSANATSFRIPGPGPSTRLGAVVLAADASDTKSSPDTLEEFSAKASPLRRSPRKLTPQKRKRLSVENDDSEDNHAPPSSPRSNVSATQDETQAPRPRFTPTKRARRTSDLSMSVARPRDALVPFVSHVTPNSTTPAARHNKQDSESLPPPSRVALVSGYPQSRTRPATSPRWPASSKRPNLFTLDKSEKPMFSPKILRTYSKQIQVPITRGRDMTFDGKAARKRGRYSAPELSTSRLQLEDEEDTEPEEGETNAGASKPIFPYEEVVRGKRRKELGAEDCEECWEYYEAVGPMPPRLQAPLWRSPSSSPQHHRHIHHHHHRAEVMPSTSSSNRGNERIGTTRPRGDVHYDADFDDAFFDHQNNAQRGKQVDSHMQEISRHRAVFSRPKTPPGFWDINFPDTPKVDALNKEAYEMHTKNENKNQKR